MDWRSVRFGMSAAEFIPGGRGGDGRSRWDAETLARGLNFTLTTDLGRLDLLGEIG